MGVLGLTFLFENALKIQKSRIYKFWNEVGCTVSISYEEIPPRHLYGIAPHLLSYCNHPVRPVTFLLPNRKTVLAVRKLALKAQLGFHYIIYIWGRRSVIIFSYLHAGSLWGMNECFFFKSWNELGKQASFGRCHLDYVLFVKLEDG